MNVIVTIAINTFREIIRDRILVVIGIFGLLLFGLSLLLGELSFAEEGRIAADFGLAGIHLSCIILSVFIGSQLVWKEIEKQTILTILVRSVNRVQFLIGKFLGMAGVLFIIELGFLIILMIFFLKVKMPINTVFFQAALGVFFESLVILSFTFLFGVISKPILTMMYVIGFFLIGHWVESLVYFANKSESQGFQLFEKIIKYTVPNLERFNWRGLVSYNEVVSLNEILWALGHTFLWVVILFLISLMLFERKDFV